MHSCLSVDEILRLFACELVASEAKATAVALACCRKSFEDPVLDALWETQNQLAPLLKCFPPGVWEQEDGSIVSPPTVSISLYSTDCFRKSFKRIPTKAEWTHSRKYAQRMRKIEVDASEDPVTPDIVLAVQLRTANDPWLPRLKTFKCCGITEEFIPFIPLFLSHKTMEIDIQFAEDTSAVVTASMISRFSTLCPELMWINLNDLPRHSVITEAVSEMLLACNRNTLQGVYLDSPLTQEAREVIYRLPELSDLWVVIQGPTSLPTVALPNLTSIDVEYGDDLDWLEGFRGATLEKLDSATFRSESNRIGDFLRAFESVASTTSSQNTLSKLKFFTSRSWNPNYSSLLSFNQLKEVEIQFSCSGGCSSRVDDDILMSLAHAMPKLEILRLGDAPCQFPTGVTVNGLISFARRCPHLSKLCVHFQVTSLVEAATSATTLSPSDDEPVVQREGCALTDLEVGDIPVPAQSALAVAQILLQIFPRILNVGYINPEWKTVAEIVKHFRQIAIFVRRTGEAHPSHSMIYGDTLPGDATD